MPRRRQLLPVIRQALAGPEPGPALAALGGIAPAVRLGPLFSLLLDREPLIGWRAVTAFGAAMAELAGERQQDAREVWRNLMWRTNEESGNIAWGIPQCMGETLARVPVLAADYHRILISLVQDLDGDCTYIDHAPLRRGVWWAIARLAEAAPELAARALPELTAAVADCDPEARGLACLALARLKPDPSRTLLAALTQAAEDQTAFACYDGWNLVPTTVAAAADAALAACRRCG
ncbi:DVU0298 family protein [Solidesulfovibrio sp.]